MDVTQHEYLKEDEVIHGHCACGSLRYSIDIRNIANDLALSMYCHCSRCQRLNGAPYIWSNHWLYHAVKWYPAPSGPPPGATYKGGDQVSSQEGQFSPNMQTFETMKDRKWKLRCKDCGSPMGSWNAAKGKWTIWPTTIRRKQSQSLNSPTGFLAEGELDVPEFALQYIKAKHHQFYGPWRSVTLNDGLDKWLGYGGESQKVTDDGEAIT